MLVVSLKRACGQSQYSALLSAQAQSDSDKFGELEQWIAENLKSDLRIEALAERVHMSPETSPRFMLKPVAARLRNPSKRYVLTLHDAGLRKQQIE